MKRIGFLVNPVAGMGGAVGLKGTDGNVEEALRRGALPLAKNRACVTLALLADDKNLEFITCSGSMGEDALRETGITVIPGPLSFRWRKQRCRILRGQHKLF